MIFVVVYLFGAALVLNNVLSDNDVTAELVVGAIAAAVIWPVVLLIGAVFVLGSGGN